MAMIGVTFCYTDMSFQPQGSIRMNDLVPLHFEQADVRMVLIDGNPWWVLIDVCGVLGIKNPTQVAGKLDADERSMFNIGRQGSVVIVSMPGLLKIILRSKEAISAGTFPHRFCRWVTHEVIPTIFRHGQYPAPEYALDDPDRVQDLRSTPQQRFIAECQRLAEQNCTTVAELLHHIISPQQQRAIELGHGPMVDLLHKDRRWEMFLGIGMDLQYVLRGVWGQTPQERRVMAQMRAAKAASQQGALPCEP